MIQVMRFWCNRICWKKVLFLCIILVICFMMGCRTLNRKVLGDNKRQVTLENNEEPLKIFYDGTGYNLLKSFMEAHPRVEIDLVKCIPLADDEIDLKEIIKKNGIPDLILAEETLSVYLAEWYTKGYIANLADFCSDDISLNADSYFPDTFDVFNDEGILYALPLGISLDFMLVSESNYRNSFFPNLEEGFTGRELLYVFLEEIKKEKEPGAFFAENSLNILVLLKYLNGLTQDKDCIHVDEEIFKMAYEFLYLNRKEAVENKNYWHGQGKYYNWDSGYGYPSALDPRRYDGSFTTSIWNQDDAPALVLSYAETAYQHYCNEGIRAIYFPTFDDGDQHQARVKFFGAIAEESSQKQLAYDLLRELMDQEITSYLTVNGTKPTGSSLHSGNFYPINIKNAINMLEQFESSTTHLVYGQQSSTNYLAILERVNVTEEEKEKHIKMLNGISGLFCHTNELRDIGDIFEGYFENNIMSYKSCYYDTVNRLNSLSHE